MRESKTQLSTFLMFCILIMVSSINDKISESKKEVDFSSTWTHKKNEERLIKDKKVSLRIGTSREIEKSLHEKELANNPATKEDQTNLKTQLFKGDSLSGSPLFLKNPKNHPENTTDSNQIQNINAKPSIFSFFPYSLSMNLLGISSENTKISNFQTDEAAKSNSNQMTDGNSTNIYPNIIKSADFQIPVGNPASVLDNSEIKYRSMFAYILFGTSYLIVRLILSCCKNSKNEQRKYFIKGMKIITNQNFIYFILLTVLIVFSAFGLFDFVKINLEYIIASLAIFGFSWIIFCMIVLSFCIMIGKKWDELEINSRNSFGNVIFFKLLDFLKANIDYKGDNKGVFEIYEYLILKYFFCIPQYQVMKESNLRKEINFAYYLKYCLIQNFRLLTKLSWTCWVAFIFLMYIWSVYVSNLSILYILIVMLTVPIIGILVAVLVYFYMKKVYRRIIDEVDSFRVTTKWTDIEAFKPNIYKRLPLPNYLTKIEDEAVSSFSFHEHFHGRAPTFYEDQIIFGSTGFFFILNIIQTIGFLFNAWCILIFVKHFDAIYQAYGYVSLSFIIPIMLIYLGVFSYVLSISLRWYTLIASIEMKRNNKAIKKLIQYHTKKAGELSNEIFKNFKRIYYEIAIKDNKDALGQDYARKMIKIQMKRFLKNSGDENCFISIDTQLKSFLNTTGNKLNQSELQYLLYFLDDVDSLENDKITKEQFCDLYHAFMKFSEEKPQSILNDVLDHYFMNEKLDPSEMDVDKVRHFFDTFNEFFTQEQINYVMIECSYLEKKFSRDSFNFVVLAPRKYYPY